MCGIKYTLKNTILIHYSLMIYLSTRPILYIRNQHVCILLEIVTLYLTLLHIYSLVHSFVRETDHIPII